MRILPVLDIRFGLVVRGIAGRRHEYAPIISNLAPSPKILDVAVAFRTHLGLSELYLADLDAIAGAHPALAIYESLRTLGFRLWVDAGLRDSGMAADLITAGVEKLVFGLETLRGPEALRQAVEQHGPRVVFSLDLKDGEVLGNRMAWRNGDAWSIASDARSMGVRRMIVLDLARVGICSGIGTEELCRRVAAEYPDVEVIAGGGVRGVADLRRLKSLGVRGVLIASALHDGVLRREELAEFVDTE
jgi:phosphoribosylformimino-5-aminoimidazole carboxamide ribotide isomerase